MWFVVDYVAFWLRSPRREPVREKLKSRVELIRTFLQDNWHVRDVDIYLERVIYRSKRTAVIHVLVTVSVPLAIEYEKSIFPGLSDIGRCDRAAWWLEISRNDLDQLVFHTVSMQGNLWDYPVNIVLLPEGWKTQEVSEVLKIAVPKAVVGMFKEFAKLSK